MEFFEVFRYRREILFVFSLIFIFLLVLPPSLASRVTLIDNESLNPERGEVVIDGIGNFDNDLTPEIVYGYYRSPGPYGTYIFTASKKSQIQIKEIWSSGGSYFKELYDIEGFHDWDDDGDKDLFLSRHLSKDGSHPTLYMIDYREGRIGAHGCHPAGLAHGFYKNEEKLFYYCKGNNLYGIPKHIVTINDTYSLYNGSWSPNLKKSIAIGDINNDSESELIGILQGSGTLNDNLVWYDFYNSTANFFKVNAIELMDETYDVDNDGFQEVFYVNPQNNLFWIDVNREKRVTNVNASKLGGIGNWDQDGFKELSFIDPGGNVKIFELYQLLAEKSVFPNKLGLGGIATVEIRINNNRRKPAYNFSIKDSFPNEFLPLSSDSITLNLTSEGNSEQVEVPLEEKSDRYEFTLSHFNTTLLREIPAQTTLNVSYWMRTPYTPGTYRLPGAEVYWQEW